MSSGGQGNVRLILPSLLALLCDMRQGKPAIKITHYTNIMTEVPKSYVSRPSFIERLGGKQNETVRYESLEITRIWFDCQFSEVIDGRYEAMRGKILTADNCGITREIAHTFEETARAKGLLTEVSNCEDIKIDLRPIP